MELLWKMWFNINPIQISSYLVNITNIHDTMVSLFREEFLSRHEMKKRIDTIELIVRHGNEKNRVIAKKELLRLKGRYEMISSHTKLREYMVRSKPIIDEYKVLTKDFKPWVRRTKADGKRPEKIKLSSLYIVVLSDFVPVQIEKPWLLCNNCGETITNFASHCPRCKKRLSNFESLLPDSRFLKKITPSNYDRSENFREVLLKFQGKWRKKPTDEAIEGIREYCKRKRFDMSKFNNRDMRRTLKDLRLTDYYYDVNYIMSEICGSSLPDFGQYEEQILDRFDIYKHYFEEYKPKERSNSFRAQYMIYQFASQEGLDLDSNLFFLFETIDVKLECDRVNKFIFSIIQSERPNENWSFFNV